MRNQDPFFLEVVVRFDRDNMMRMPKIIPLHAGYPSVGKAAWLSHLYPKCYFELSIMTTHVHQYLYQRYMQVMEVVPLSKILFASDAYHIPELYWLAGRWGKRYLAKALTDYRRRKPVSGGGHRGRKDDTLQEQPQGLRTR
ncbi:amidohydrolase family protein [Sinorhizobium meliloti]|uniref:amidohydrolase family protein n=1 Tax=Rhizobium meliloti TaxID=382 RepID=UPI001F32626C|nr:amidohydrolase family protein [Sinorhizobium meliloti]